MKHTLDRLLKLNLYPNSGQNLLLKMRDIFSKRENLIFTIFPTITLR